MQRFYGGHPADWLHIPSYLLHAYMVTMEKLEGEYRLATVAVTMIGTGSVEKDYARTVIREWQDMAGASATVKATSAEAHKAALAARGIDVD